MENRTKSEVGKRGEDVACEYLKRKGYKIIDRNYREVFGEIDVIARAKDKTLVFVEVKTMSGFYPDGLQPYMDEPSGLQPEDQMSSAKRKKFEKISNFFALKNPKLIDDKKGWRMDVVAIVLIGEKDFRVRHYENM